MNRSESEDDDRHKPTRGQLIRGIAAAALVDTFISVPLGILIPLVRPDNVAAAIGNLLFGLNMLVGYVGGRVAVRAGISHEDSGSQWTMAAAVAGVSVLTERMIERLRMLLHLVHVEPTTAQAANERTVVGAFFFWLVAMMLLIRFGFAMGTYSQAKREGRVQDEDEASVE
jgi:hypothetical protein